MAITYIREFEVGADRSTSNYDAIGEKLNLVGDPPDGLILHTAGFSGSKFRMIEVWESQEQFEQFEGERLVPAIQEVAGRNGSEPSTESFETHNLVAP